jgi:hypothetical protein
MELARAGLRFVTGLSMPDLSKKGFAMRNNVSTLLRAVSVGACVAMSPLAFGADLFTVSATGSGVPTVNVGGSNIIDLVDDAVNTQGQFAAFQNVNSTFSLNYGGVANAIVVTKNAGNTSATIQLLGQPVRTFTGANQADLENQIEDYLKKDGSADLTNFFQTVNQQSVIGVSDGNPNSTTARMAEFTYNKFGLYADQFKAYTLRPAPAPEAQSGDANAEAAASPGVMRNKAGVQFSLSASANTFDAGNFSGESATIASSLDFNFSERVGLSLGSFVGYNSIEDADVFHVGVGLGVPIRILLPETGATSGFTWQVTPHAVAAGSGSEDVGAGGLVYGFGATSYLAWHISNQWTLSMANQYSLYEGEELEFDEFKIDPGVDQSMLKNGLRLSFRISEQWYAYAGATYSNYLDDAAIENWLTGTVGVGYSTRAGTGVQLGVVVDNGDDYEAIGGRIGVTLAF